MVRLIREKTKMRVLAVEKHGVISEKLLMGSFFLVMLIGAFISEGSELGRQLSDNVALSIPLVVAALLGFASCVYAFLHLYYSRTTSVLCAIAIVYGMVIIGLVLGEVLAA